MRRKAILVIFDDAQVGEEAALCLQREGFTDEQVSVLARDHQPSSPAITENRPRLGTIVGITAPPAGVDKALAIMTRFNPVQMDERAAQWPRKRTTTQSAGPKGLR